MTAYYNEIDPYAAQWLRNLIAKNLIAPGDVDERSIEVVEPADLKGYTQCHFFAGIGVWSYALRQAGWSDDSPVWTGSCPCQPFSKAGKRKGFKDDRHLWPVWYKLLKQCKPPVIFGEQVASKDGLAWLDTVQFNLEEEGYSCAAADLCAAGVGAPHIRQRVYLVADTGRWSPQLGRFDLEEAPARDEVKAQEWQWFRTNYWHGLPINGSRFRSKTNGYWANCHWLFCEDKRWRAIEPAIEPLAYGTPTTVGRLRAYGNALVAPLATEFIQGYMEANADGPKCDKLTSHTRIK